MIGVFGTYLAVAAVLSVTGLVFVGLTRVAAPLLSRAPERWLRWCWLLLVLAVVLPVVLPRLGPLGAGRARLERPGGDLGGPDVAGAIWLADPVHLQVRLGDRPGAAGNRWTLPPWGVMPAIALLSLGCLAAGGWLAWRQRRLRRFCEGLPVIRRLGRVRICASEQAAGPFAARAGGLAYIVLPISVVADAARLRLVLAHEAHHHRRGDLLAARAFAVVRALFFWNPAVAWWERVTAELQDLACDRQVLGRSWVSALDYGRCLLWAAGAGDTTRAGRLPVGARGMAASNQRILRRRIEMITEPASKGKTGLGLGVTAAALAALAAVAAVGTAWAVQGTVADHRVTREELAATAARIQQRTGFVVMADDRVVQEFNRRLANPDWRTWTRKGLERMPNYRPMIEEVLRERGLPQVLLAMVLSESAFDNEARTNRPPERQSAGVWQFMPGTARKMGLTVTSTVDERLEPRRATEAAARYLTELHTAFGGDWALAIAGYNGGEGGVKAAIAGATGGQALGSGAGQRQGILPLPAQRDDLHADHREPHPARLSPSGNVVATLLSNSAFACISAAGPGKLPACVHVPLSSSADRFRLPAGGSCGSAVPGGRLRRWGRRHRRRRRAARRWRWYQRRAGCSRHSGRWTLTGCPGRTFARDGRRRSGRPLRSGWRCLLLGQHLPGRGLLRVRKMHRRDR